MLHHLKKIVLVFFAMLLTTPLLAQTLTFSQIRNLADMHSWVTIKHRLTAKGWKYCDVTHGYRMDYDRNGDSSLVQVDTISLAYDLNPKDTNRAKAWFHILVVKNDVGSAGYRCMDKTLYDQIEKDVKSSDFKYVKTITEKKKIDIRYENKQYLLKLVTRYEEYLGKPTTAYSVAFCRKPEPQNGVYKIHAKNGVLIVYTMKDDLFNGPYKSYFPNGKLGKEGFFVNDKKEGVVKIYDEYTGAEVAEEQYSRGVLINRKNFMDGTQEADFELVEYHPTNFQVRFTGFAKGVMSLSQEYRINREFTDECTDSLYEWVLHSSAYPTEVMRYGKSILCDSLGRPVVVSSIIGNTPGDTSYFYDYTHGACDKIVRAGEDVSEMFYTVDHEPYSGDFLFPAESSQDDLQVASVKDGLRNGKTVIIDRTTGKVKEKMKFKNGMRK